MTTQLDLCFAAAAAPLQQDAETERVLTHLRENPGFHTARQLSAALDLTDRQIRKAAETSGNEIVSGPGSPGYCHITHCPPEKIAHIADTLRSQARHMLARSIRLRNTAHAIIR
jgi:hypothetical protein